VLCWRRDFGIVVGPTSFGERPRSSAVSTLAVAYLGAGAIVALGMAGCTGCLRAEVQRPPAALSALLPPPWRARPGAWYAALSTGGSMEGSQSTSRRRRNRRSSARHRVSHRFQEGSASASPDRHAQLGSQLRLQTPCRVSSELLSSQSTRPGRLGEQAWWCAIIRVVSPRDRRGVAGLNAASLL